MVSVNKGDWDRSRGADANHEFNRAWLAACQRVLKPNGTIWVSGTSHVIHSVGFAMQQLNFKLLNDITWVKPNPPPNLSCRYFTHATETIIWAAKDKKSRHTFNYKLMRQHAGGRQMQSVWKIHPPGKDEKNLGKYPAQKPLALVERILQAASSPRDVVLDPFMGSGTTAIAALHLSRCVIAAEREDRAIDLGLARIIDELVVVRTCILSLKNGLDLSPRSVDRSSGARTGPMATGPSGKLVRRECRYYFVGEAGRDVIYSVAAATLDEAWQSFLCGGGTGSDIFLVIKTETEIYLADKK